VPMASAGCAATSTAAASAVPVPVAASACAPTPPWASGALPVPVAASAVAAARTRFNAVRSDERWSLLRTVRLRAWRIAFFADLIFGMARKLDGKLRRVKTIHYVWAVTDPELRSQYSFGVGVNSDWTQGSRYEAAHAAAGVAIAEGENLEVDPPHRLVQSLTALWSDDVKAEGTSRVTWEIEQIADSCRLTVTHDQLREGANDELYGGWPMILSGLKTLLETGERLTTPGSLMYADATSAS